MSKLVKQEICKELVKMLDGVDACMIVDPTGLDGITANQLRRDMAAVKVQMQLVKNSLTKRALAGTKLEAVGGLLDGPCALVWSAESISDAAKVVVKKVKQFPKLVIKGAVLEGSPIPADKAAELAKLPTKAEMKGQIVGLVASPGRKLAATVLGAGARIANLLKGRIEALEKAEPKAEEKPAA